MNSTKAIFRPSGYYKPGSVAEAVKILGEHSEDGWFLAGGTDLLVERDPQVGVLVDVTGLGLNYIKSDSSGVKIGAATTFAEIVNSAVLRKGPYKILVEAARQVGTPQVRNVATIGGNICHAVPSADSAPVLLALDATLHATGGDGERTIDINEFFLHVRKDALGKGELLTEIQLPAFPDHTGAAFIKKGRVAVVDLAVVNTAVRFIIDERNICSGVRIVLGAVAPVPLRAVKAEEMLEGKKPEVELLEKVAMQAAEEIKPISDVRSSAEYRKTLSRVIVERALGEAVAQARA